MRIPSAPRLYAISLAVAVLAFVAALSLMGPAPVEAPRKASNEELTLAWLAGGDLQVEGLGYRSNGIVEIQFGSGPGQRTHADPTGQVRLIVPHRLIAAGQPGASVVVVGRSRIGTSRTLISAVPPKPAARGPADALPWAGAAGVLAYVSLALLRGRRRGPRAGPATPSPQDLLTTT